MPGLIHHIKRGGRGLLDELFPPTGTSLTELPDAGDWSPDPPNAYCPRCGASLGSGETGLQRGCRICERHAIHWDRITRLGSYQPPLAEWIRDAKFHRQWQLAPLLGQALAAQIPAPFDAERIAVCPVPMHWRRRWRRGYNQAQLIAQAIADERGWPLVELLQRTRHTAPQTTVTPGQRVGNVRGSFALEELELDPCEILLVDDVKTTGATLNHCARLLRKAGAKSVQVAVAAVANPRTQHDVAG